MSDTKPSVLEQRWEISGWGDGRFLIRAIDRWIPITGLSDREIADHIVELHNADLDASHTRGEKL